MTHNVENWTFKRKSELEALDDKELLRVSKELWQAFRAFRDHGVNPTDEMVWQMMVIPGIISERGLKDS